MNDVILSCYATDRSHHLVNLVFLPVRVGMINNVEKYFDTLIYVFNYLQSGQSLIYMRAQRLLQLRKRVREA